MFDIRFLDAPPEKREEGGYGLWGEITLGDYREQFLAPITLWSRERYEQQWREAADRLLRGAERTAFFTATWQFWWTMATQGDAVLVQEEILTGDRVAPLGPMLDPDVAPYGLLEPVRLRSEDGEEISTWRVTLADVEAFAVRNRERDPA